MEGSVESLWGKVNVNEMGSRIQRTKPASTLNPNTPIGALPGGAKTPASLTTSALSLTTRYRPRSQATAQIWEYLLAAWHSWLGSDVSGDVVACAADTALATLKNEREDFGEEEKKRSISEDICALDNEQWTQLVNLCGRITDYGKGVVAGRGRGGEEPTIAILEDREQDESKGYGDEQIFTEEVSSDSDDEEAEKDSEREASSKLFAELKSSREFIDIQRLIFPLAGHTMTNTDCILPTSSQTITTATHQEILIPPPKPLPLSPEERLLPIKSLPGWMQTCFPPSTTSLNRIQSAVCPSALGSDANLLVCAPTGAGKTNVALLTVLRCISNFVDSGDLGQNAAATRGTVPIIRKNDFKIVYIAPMKALVQEMTKTFAAKLAPLSLLVRELTGDHSLTSREIKDAQMLICTPEKFDILGRKSGEWLKSVALVIVDEVHLLHDDRGPVLESIIARCSTHNEGQCRSPALADDSLQVAGKIRLLGLSATLPNYKDVARFMRVQEEHCFYFDASYRPCPLAQIYCSINESNALKARNLLNTILLTKIAERIGKHQIITFVHSRKDTWKTAEFIKDALIKAQQIANILGDSHETRSTLNTCSEQIKNSQLAALLPYGIGIHHAGLSRADRQCVEELFSAGHLQLLFCTATLAWGVNLPAHTVIIKGTQIYNPQLAGWCELSSQDILQMLGRAGRPQYDRSGEGIIITDKSAVTFYLSLMNQQLPIESQLASKIVDCVCAEIVGGCTSVDSLLSWMKRTFFWVRMCAQPSLYNVSDDVRGGEGGGGQMVEESNAIDDACNDHQFIAHATKIIKSTLCTLHLKGLVHYNAMNGKCIATPLGTISSHFYVNHKSIHALSTTLHPAMDTVTLIDAFASTDEFSTLSLRVEEQVELRKLAQQCPLPILDPATPKGKCSILLQSWIGRMDLEGFALMADMVTIVQSAVRLLRAIVAICEARGWPNALKCALALCLAVEHRLWPCSTPLRQRLPSGAGEEAASKSGADSVLPAKILARLERSAYPWRPLFELSPVELGELVRSPAHGPILHKKIHAFPLPTIQAQTIPITRQLIRIDLEITLSSTTSGVDGSDGSIPPAAYPFYLIVSDVDGQRSLHHQHFTLYHHNASSSFNTTLYVADTSSPIVCVECVSSRWLGSAGKLSIPLLNISLPPPPAAPLTSDGAEAGIEADGASQPSSSLKDGRGKGGEDAPAFASSSSPVEHSSIPTRYKRCIPALLHSNENVLLAARGPRHNIYQAALLSIHRLLAGGTEATNVVYWIVEDAASVARSTRWLQIALKAQNSVLSVSSHHSADEQDKAVKVIVCDAEAFLDCTLRSSIEGDDGDERSRIHPHALTILDNLHALSTHPNIEILCSLWQKESDREDPVRRIYLSDALSAPAVVAGWLGCRVYFNFGLSSSSGEGEGKEVINLRAVESNDGGIIIETISDCIAEYCDRVGDASECQLMVICNDPNPSYLLQTSINQEQQQQEQQQQSCAATFSAAIISHEMDIDDAQRVFNDNRLIFATPASATNLLLFVEGRDLRLIIDDASKPLALNTLNALFSHTASMSRCTVITTKTRQPMLKHLLSSPCPLESCLDTHLPALLNRLVYMGAIDGYASAVEWLADCLLVRVCTRNPAYYGVQGVGGPGGDNNSVVAVYLSELVEDAFGELEGFLAKERPREPGNDQEDGGEDEDAKFECTNLGMIAAHYSLDPLNVVATIHDRIAQVPSLAFAYILDMIADVLGAELSIPAPPLLALLKSYFERRLQLDDAGLFALLRAQSLVLKYLYAAIDIAASATANPLQKCLSLMEFSQLFTQSLAPNKPEILQLFDNDGLWMHAKDLGMQSVYDLNDDLFTKYTSDCGSGGGEDDAQRVVERVSSKIARYPSMDIQVQKSIDTDSISYQIEAGHRWDECVRSCALDTLKTAWMPVYRQESWWILVIAQAASPSATDQIVSITKIPIDKAQIAGQIDLDDDGLRDCKFKVLFVSDAYLGVDQEFIV